VSIETTVEGVPIQEEVLPGLFTFTPDGRLSVVSASKDSVMAYAGRYTVEGDVLSIRVDSCVVREVENTVITRKILEFDGTRLVLEAVGVKSKQRSVLTWKKKFPL
jgi:hypothetical protein